MNTAPKAAQTLNNTMILLDAVLSALGKGAVVDLTPVDGGSGQALTALQAANPNHPWLMEAEAAIGYLNGDAANADLQKEAREKVLRIAEAVSQTGDDWQKLKYESLKPLQAGYTALKALVNALKDPKVDYSALQPAALAAAGNAAKEVTDVSVAADVAAEKAAFKVGIIAIDNKGMPDGLTDLVPNTNRLQYMFARLMNVWQSLVVYDLKSLNALMTDIADQRNAISVGDDAILEDWEIRYAIGSESKAEQWGIYAKEGGPVGTCIYPVDSKTPFSSHATLKEYIDAINGIDFSKSMTLIENNPAVDLLGGISPVWQDAAPVVL
jgi:hypothetical protein